MFGKLPVSICYDPSPSVTIRHHLIGSSRIAGILQPPLQLNLSLEITSAKTLFGNDFR